MQRSHFLTFSVLFHIIFLFLFFFIRSTPPKAPKEDTSYYFYQDEAAFAESAPKPHANTQAATSEEKAWIDQGEIALYKKEKINYDKTLNTQLKNFDDIVPRPHHTGAYAEPIRMIGEKLLDDPLRKLLGRAFTKKLYYPEIARSLYKHGITTIGFVLHPSGEIIGARVLQTSKEKLLDDAALSAINAASPVHQVNLYVKEPRYFIINIIF
ncbi:MAG: TonB family protein [Gammaproteobacteria bacterium]|nr:TonB family protein [Gammaproteobacteria bacterium]